MGEMETNRTGRIAVMMKMIPKLFLVDSSIADGLSNCNDVLESRLGSKRSFLTLKGKATALSSHKLSQIGFRGDRFSSSYFFSSRGALLLLTRLTRGRFVLFISNVVPLPVFYKTMHTTMTRTTNQALPTRNYMPHNLMTLPLAR